MDLQDVGGGHGDWIELAQDRDRWRALVGTVSGLSGSINAGNFLTSCKVCVVMFMLAVFVIYYVQFLGYLKLHNFAF
jgi:hypothetical protein